MSWSLEPGETCRSRFLSSAVQESLSHQKRPIDSHDRCLVQVAYLLTGRTLEGHVIRDLEICVQEALQDKQFKALLTQDEHEQISMCLIPVSIVSDNFKA